MEYAYSVEQLTHWLEQAGFVNIAADAHGPQAAQGRVFFTAENTPH